MKLDAIMKRFPQTVESTDTLTHARDFMVWGDFHHLPVVDRASGRLVGILTDNDIARHQSITGESIWDRPSDSVDMAMSSVAFTADPDDTLDEAARRMISREIDCLPITQEDKLVGLVTYRDILSAEARAFSEAQNQFEPEVQDVMHARPQSVHPEDHVLDAAARMLQYQIRCLPVINGDRQVVGMLFDRDVRAIVGDPARGFTEEAPESELLPVVRELMRKPDVVVHRHQSCVTAARMLAATYATVVPVVGDDNRLVGVVSYVDLLRAFTQ
jgi:CBS-domain-containing membrane protein